MSISDIIWPWAALRRERSRLCRARETLRELELRVDAYEYKLGEIDGNLREKELRLLLAENEIAKLRKKIATGHFRNPETGRIGKKGQTFQ